MLVRVRDPPHSLFIRWELGKPFGNYCGGFSESIIIVWHIAKELYTLSQKYLNTYVHCNSAHNCYEMESG